jgi:hypothetical protein
MDTRSVVQSALDVMLNRAENRMFFDTTFFHSVSAVLPDLACQIGSVRVIMLQSRLIDTQAMAGKMEFTAFRPPEDCVF